MRNQGYRSKFTVGDLVQDWREGSFTVASCLIAPPFSVEAYPKPTADLICELRISMNKDGNLRKIRLDGCGIEIARSLSTRVAILRFKRIVPQWRLLRSLILLAVRDETGVAQGERNSYEGHPEHHQS
jgi:hypothetical protein